MGTTIRGTERWARDAPTVRARAIALARWLEAPFQGVWRAAGRIRQRLGGDFKLALISLLGACGVAGITPFAIYRFATGSFWIGVIDSLIAAGIGALVLYAWRTGDTRRTGILLLLVNTSGSTAVAMVLGFPGLFWTYPTFMSNYFLAERGKAMAATVVSLVVLAVHGKAFASTFQMTLFAVTASIVSLFALIFAQRAESQRMKLEALATIDPLTGVPNRRAMEHELKIAVERHRRDGTACGVLMLDLDHFKSINDRHGHETGDRVLVAFASLIRRSTRQVDRLFRFGGEEFVVLLAPASTEAMAVMAAKLCRTVANETHLGPRPVTVSIGAAALRPGEDWPALLARADAALYRAKDGGRNRAVVDEAPDEPVPASRPAR